jgi:hypothetical protein
MGIVKYRIGKFFRRMEVGKYYSKFVRAGRVKRGYVLLFYACR